jgi:tetratricopeptide (TPR) repeat protein
MHAHEWNLRARRLLQAGKHAEGVLAAARAVSAEPHSASSHYTLGRALKAVGDLDGALREYQAAAALDPDFTDVHASLGVALRSLGRLPEAIRAYERALQLDSANSGVRRNLAFALLEADRVEEAELECDRLLALQPDDLDLLMLRSVLWLENRAIKPGIAALERIAQSRPDSAAAHYHLATAYQRDGRELDAARSFERAVLCYERARVTQPLDARAQITFGAALRQLGRLEDSAAVLRRAVQLAPSSAHAHFQLARTLIDQWKQDQPEDRGGLSNAGAAGCGPTTASDATPAPATASELDAGILAYQRAIELDPASPESRFHLGCVHLVLGDFERGLEGYEERLRSRRLIGLAGPAGVERWDGRPLEEATSLVVVTEQGFGDAIQFARYGALLAERGIRAILQCPRRIRSLLSRCEGFLDVIANGDFAQTGRAVWVPIMSLPRVFGTRLPTIPAKRAYLQADPARVELWRERLGSRRAFRVGICWSGNRCNDSVNGLHTARSMALEHLRPLARLSGAQLVCLQRADEAGELAEVDFGRQVLSFGEDLDRGEHAFLDTAALMMNLDLVVSCDTAVAHLAGALGVPVWLALPRIAEWRWMTGRSDSPWYPTMRLFRQPRPGEWHEVLQRMSAEIHGLIGSTLTPGKA